MTEKKNTKSTNYSPGKTVTPTSATTVNFANPVIQYIPYRLRDILKA
jgi:hypothetical protein